MKKLEINYDFIDKIYESKGKYKLKRWFKDEVNLASSLIATYFIGNYITQGITGRITFGETIAKVSSYLVGYCLAMYGLNRLHNRINEIATSQTREERADDELRKLAVQLNDLNISVNLEKLKEAYVYQKKYHLRMDGKAGIIRDRFINVPIDDNINFRDKEVSIKEEHIIGTKKYTLSIDTPQKQMVYKKVYNT